MVGSLGRWGDGTTAVAGALLPGRRVCRADTIAFSHDRCHLPKKSLASTRKLFVGKYLGDFHWRYGGNSIPRLEPDGSRLSIQISIALRSFYP